ncbi:MAG: hypothetical protein IJ362_01975 [Oscillospiraceae bacterium]|nr:hypothetical protein [Oscillospiraceae bacterium]
MNENKGKLDNVLEEEYLNDNKEKTEYTLKTGEIGEKVVSAYKKIEETVVDSYKKIEDKFVETFLEKK